MNQAPLAAVAVLMVLAGAMPAAAYPPFESGSDVGSLRGLVFAGLAETTHPAATPRGNRTVAAARKALAPFQVPLRLGGEVVTLDKTGLTDMLAAWGPAQAHGEGEVAYSLACWASVPAGRQVAFSSALDAAPPFHINGWSIARDRTTPAGCTPTTRLGSGPAPLPDGLTFGDTQARAARKVSLPPTFRPTFRSAGALEWFYILPASGADAGWSQTVVLHLAFVGGRLAAVSFSSIVTN